MTIRKRMLRHGPRTGVLATSIGALLASGGISGPAFGQDEEEEAVEGADDDAIIVTGTRIRRDDFSSTNATVVVTAEDMRNLGVISVAEMVNQLPSNVASQTPETRTDLVFNMGASIANLRGLNTSSGSRTLVLVDSNRFVSSNSSGSVDMNMIPTALVGRIETVTGGASATYGADAMAGVVNVILDNNIEGVRVDLSYNTTDAGDGDNVALSLGTGFEVFDRRGRITLGYDHSQQDPIDDCTTREYCQHNWGVMNQNLAPAGFAGTPMFRGGTDPLTAGTFNGLYPDQPQYIIREGMQFTRLPQGITIGAGPTDPNFGLGAPASTIVFASHATTGMTAANVGSYRFSDDGMHLVPYLDDLSTADRAYVVAEGAAGSTPFGSGGSIYQNVPLLGAQDRDNLFARFSYDLEGGIGVTASLTYGETNTLTKQNSIRQTGMTLPCIFPTNGFLSPEWGADEYLREMISDRRINSAPVPATNMGGAGTCRPGPYLGNVAADNLLPTAQQLYDFPEAGGTTGISKSMHPFINRMNDTDTKTTNLTLGANGDLFEGGSWTWDASLNWGASEREGTVQNQQSARRVEMATHSLWDPTQNRVVCAIDSNAPYVAPTGQGPSLVAAYGPFATMGQYWSARWQEYIRRSINGGVADPGYEAEALAYFNNLAGREAGTDPCAPFNPFGLTPDTASVAYIWPSITSFSENSQDGLSLSFSGDIGEGIGAGPFRMAAGMDYRMQESKNYGNPNAYTARDFANLFAFADNWTGETETSEAFVEFDFPVLRDLPVVDYLMFNVAARKTESTNRRLEGNASILTQESENSTESWKASMVWQPVDLMRVRVTRSADTRAPTAQELFQTNGGSLSTGGQNEVATYFRLNDPATTINEALDYLETYSDGGNSTLSPERSVTQTVGVVFTPTELLSGLQLSIDYYETDIKGGIQNVGAGQVDDRCAQQLLNNGFVLDSTAGYCENIVFGEPDLSQDVPLTDQAIIDQWNQYAATPLALGDPNPMVPFTNIETIAGTAENAAPYFSRGIDVSVSYNTQLSGGGVINARVIASRALEQTVHISSGSIVVFGNTAARSIRDVSGQTGSNGLGSAGGGFAAANTLNYSPTPRISGNMFMTYQKNAFSVTSQVRYIGSGRLNRQQEWVGPGEVGYAASGAPFYYAPLPLPPPAAPPAFQYPYPSPTGATAYPYSTVTDGDLPSWATLNLNFEYDFSRSALSFERFESLSVFLNVENVGNRTPDFFSGTGAGGINTTYFSGIGREYRMGVRMQF